MLGQIRRNRHLAVAVAFALAFAVALAGLASCQTNADNADDDVRREALTSSGEIRDPTAVRSEIVPLANGRGTMLRRSPEIRNGVVGHRGADGAITTSCVDDADGVAALFRDPSQARANGVAQ